MTTMEKALSRPTTITRPSLAERGAAFWKLVAADWRRNKYVYIILLPVVLYYLIFHYGPMYGALIAFQDFNPAKGLLASKWVGLENFRDFFDSVYFVRLVRNTVMINVLELV